MSYILKIGLILLIGICFFKQQGTAQSLEQTYAHAVEQYELKNTTAATQSFQRVIFFDSTKTYPKAYQYLADCFFTDKNYEQAVVFFDIAASYQNEKDSLYTELVFNKCNALLLQKKFNQTLIELYSLEDSLSNNFMVKRELYLAITFFGLEKYDESHQHFLEISPNIQYQTSIDSLFKENAKISKFSPKKASYLSMGLPGLGQFYSGDLKNGFNSLGLNAVLLSAFLITVSSSGVLNAVLIIYPWYQRYFIGGFQAARRNAIIIKQERRADIYQVFLKKVESLRTIPLK